MMNYIIYLDKTLSVFAFSERLWCLLFLYIIYGDTCNKIGIFYVFKLPYLGQILEYFDQINCIKFFWIPLFIYFKILHLRYCFNFHLKSLFQKYVFKGISHPVFYGDLLYKLRRVKDTPNFISSGSKIVKRLRRRQYDPLIIETTIGLVLGPCTALCRLFLKHCTLTNKAVGTIWRALSKPPQRRQGPDLRPLWLLVGTPSAIRPELAFSRAEHSLPYSDVTIYIFAILYLSSMPYV